MEKATFIHLLLNLYKSANTNEKVASRGNNVLLKKTSCLHSFFHSLNCMLSLKGDPVKKKMN